MKQRIALVGLIHCAMALELLGRRLSMIHKNTVLVLGAGASKPYGFPTGREICDQILADNEVGSGPIYQLLDHCGFDAGQSGEMFRAFKDSGHYSLDAFVQRRPEFRTIAKTAIAGSLMAKENEGSLFSDPNADWYRHLMVGMMQDCDREAFRANRLTVITFNFDRSFERRLFRSLKANYALSDAEAGELTAVVPVMHIHGQLGPPGWIAESGRRYGAQSGWDEVRQCAAQIRLIDDEIDQALLGQARDLLQDADRVCFLGFSFHPDNLNRLNANRLRDTAMWGTRVGLSSTETQRAYRYFNSPRRDYLLNQTAREFFDSVDLFD
jgi:hypothetical protein